MVGMVDVRPQFNEYEQTHSSWLHVVCVPLILWSAMTFVAEVEFHVPVPGVGSDGAVSLAYLMAGFFAVVYFILDPAVGLLVTGLLAGMAYTGIDYVTDEHTAANAYQIAFAVHVIAWVVHFVSRWVYDKKAPSFSLQNLLLSPFFIILEVLTACGLRSRSDKSKSS